MDIVERLQLGRIDKSGVRRSPDKVKREAAAEIKALRAELAARDAEIAAWLREGGVYERPGPANVAMFDKLATAIASGQYRQGEEK